MATKKRKWYQTKTGRGAIATGVIGTIAMFPPAAVIPVIGITAGLAAKILTMWAGLFTTYAVADRAGKGPEE
jgi:hypothetical protein